MADLIAHARDGVRWEMAACESDQHVDPRMLRRLDAAQPGIPIKIGCGAWREAAARADVLVVWGLSPSEVWSKLPGTDRPAMVLVAHGIGDWTANLMRSAADADTLAAVSHAAVATFPPAARRRVRVIPNMADPGRLVPRRSRRHQRKLWGVGPDQKALVMVGRLSPEKNPEAVADAVAELQRRGHREWVGVHVGDGWAGDATRAHAEAVAPGLVQFAGVTDDVGSAYWAADLVCLPSKEEACALAMLESWAVGAPLIASTVGLASEPEYAALCRTVPPGCSGVELAEAVLAEMGDPDGSAARVARARQVARTGFGPERFGAAWSELIRGLVCASGQKSAAIIPESIPVVT